MNNRTLTSANAIILISVQGLYPAAQRIQGFSADDIFDTDAIQPAETSMGVDGRLSAGFVPVSTKMNITLQADSLSIDLFETWLQTEKALREKLVANGVVVLPSVQKKYQMTRGFLLSVPQTPAMRKSAQPRRFTLEWENVSPSPYL